MTEQWSMKDEAAQFKANAHKNFELTQTVIAANESVEGMVWSRTEGKEAKHLAFALHEADRFIDEEFLEENKPTIIRVK